MYTLDFKPLDAHALELIKEYSSNSRYLGSDYSYFAYLIWFEQVEYAEGDRALFLRAFFDGRLRYWQPLVKDGQTAMGAIAQLPPLCTFFGCSEGFSAQLSEEYASCYDRNYSEYIYLTEDFISLVGKRYNAKRNHVHKFKALYNYEMTPYKPDDRGEVLAFEEEWFESHRFDSENAERSAMREREIMFAAIDATAEGKTVCDLLRVDGKLVGFSVGERLSDECAVIIYEKADTAYDGIYSFLAHEFAARNFSDCKYINRQEDMGLEGLRKSKLSYCPEFLLDKYVLEPRRVAGRDIYTSVLGYDVAPLKEDHFNIVMSFLQDGIASLADKKFFLNYKDSELMGVLGNGHMLGAFDGDALIATVGVDLDREYGKKLAEICGDNSGRQFYEFSGIMVKEEYRGKGIARALCGEAISWARREIAGSTLCAVVQKGNIPSERNLLGLGFKLSGRAPYKEYDFEYFTLEI